MFAGLSWCLLFIIERLKVKTIVNKSIFLKEIGPGVRIFET